MHSLECRKAFLTAVLLSACSLLAEPALAFKPITHVYLAEVARDDAIDDGKVTIYEVDYTTGKIKTDGSGNLKEVGRYAVRPEILEALRSSPAQYRAGVIGPDGYPDLLTGQQLIHPAGRVTPGETDVDLNPGGPGPGPWLTHLWKKAFVDGDPAHQTPAARAFTVGYLTHAAGDMYSHTFVNYYAGGAFHFHPDPNNAIKHILLEGYVAKRTPDPTFDASISGVEGFIVDNMTFGKKDTYLLDTLLKGDNQKFSIPAVYSRKYVWLTKDIDEYEAKKNELVRKIEEARDNFQADRVLRLTAELTEYNLRNRLRIAYYKAWRDDVEDGLKEWPKVSHQVTQALMFNDERKTDIDRTKEILNNYVNDHLLSMSGAPDAIGDINGFIQDWLDRIVNAIGIPAVEEQIARMKQSLYDYILEKSFGITATDLKKYLQDPENQFDHVMDNPIFFNGGGNRISRTNFDQNELRLNGQHIDHTQWPVAYNTVVMTKLLYLSKDEVNRLMSDLGSAETLSPQNAMLDFCETLDGNNQWKANPKKMVVARDSLAYRQIFMQQTGEDPARGQWKFGARFVIGPTGCRLISLTSGGAAEQAGLQVGDVIKKVDGEPVGAADYMTNHLTRQFNRSSDGKVLLVVLRNGTTSNIQMQLEPAP